MTLCRKCPNPIWCGKNGCTAFNEESRQKLERIKHDTWRENKLMDEIEADIGFSR